MNLNQLDQEKEGAVKVEGRARTQTVPRCCTKPGQRMEHFVCVPQGVYQGTQLALGQPGLSDYQQSYWRQNAGAPTFLARTGLVVPTNAWAYCMEPYKREQLKAILSQMNPSLSLWLCKANTKEVGVQVSLQVDRSLQGSLGPLTLCSCSPWGHRVPKMPSPAWDHYSPVMGLRGLVQLQEDGKDKERQELSGSTEATHQQQKLQPRPRLQEDKQEELWQQDKLGKEDDLSPRETQSKQAQRDTHPLRKPNFR